MFLHRSYFDAAKVIFIELEHVKYHDFTMQQLCLVRLSLRFSL